MFRVGLAPAGESAAEERLEAEFEVAHFHDPVDLPFRSSPAKARTSMVTSRSFPFCAFIRSSLRV